MALPRKLLGEDEHVEIHLRTHAKALILPAVALILLGAAVGVGAALIPDEYAPIGPLVVVAIGVVLAVWWCLLPFLRWATTTYTVTNRRLITRSGILTKTGRDLPLLRINDVSYERSLLDRLLGCGTLQIQTAADQGVIVLDDVPDVEQVHVIMSELLFSGGDR
ncbi:PH domain-containing protein [Microlunatus soli]|uniref:PH domain-containing protein n=1 Tax=Microlunatus soli TaxID=630515 RepID=A0A1H1XAV7_9ACTN|nr:PH domain-containing protein [Microlunatus soli]SDT06171.1 PH domain-containing protein [Microlunatus soli]